MPECVRGEAVVLWWWWWWSNNAVCANFVSKIDWHNLKLGSHFIACTDYEAHFGICQQNFVSCHNLNFLVCLWKTNTKKHRMGENEWVYIFVDKKREKFDGKLVWIFNGLYRAYLWYAIPQCLELNEKEKKRGEKSSRRSRRSWIRKLEIENHKIKEWK